MEDLTPDGEQSQGSVWDTPVKKKSVWDTPVTPTDPAKARAKLILREGVKQTPEQAAELLRLSKSFGVDEKTASYGLDKFRDALKVRNLEDIPDTNPKLADAMTDTIGTAGATQKFVPQLRQLDVYYNRPAELLPLNDRAIQEKARRIADLRAERDWTANPGVDYARMAAAAGGTGMVPAGGAQRGSYSSKQQMADSYFQQELENRRAIEAVMAGAGEMTFRESAIAKLPNDTALQTVTSYIPFASKAPGLSRTIDLAAAKRAIADGSADEIQRDIVDQARRLAGIQKFRGKDFLAGLAEHALTLPATAAEMAAGGALGRSVSGALGLGKAAGFFAEPAIGAATTGLPDAAESFVGNLGEGDSAAAAVAKGARDAFAGYFGAKLFGPWFSKATPEAQALVKESLLKTIPAEAIKFPLMNIASSLIQSVGPDMAEHLKQTEIYRAIQGDPEALKSLTQQLLVGGASGLGHAVVRNIGIDNLIRERETYAKAAQERAALLEDFAKENPELAAEMSHKLAAGGPNENTYIPVKAFGEHYGNEARTKIAEMGLDPAKYDAALKTGEDLIIPTATYDHAIGLDPSASKFFAEEIRPAPGEINLREARSLEDAYNSGVRIPARERIIQQIMEQAKGDKIKEAAGIAEIDLGEDQKILDVLGLKPEEMDAIKVASAKARYATEDVLVAKQQAKLDKLKSDLYEKEKARTTEAVTKEVDQRPEQLALSRLQKHQLPDGTPLSEDVPKIKLSKQALEAEGYKASSLPRGTVADGNFAQWGDTSTHGIALSPEDAAPMLGFNSGHDLLLALAGTNRDLAIKQEVDSRMAGKFPGGLQPSELSQEAIKALHNPYSAKYQHEVLKHLEAATKNKLSGIASRKLPSLPEITKEAREFVANEKLGQLDPDRWRAAEQDAMREAQAAAFSAKKEALDDLFDARMKMLHAHERYRAAVEMGEDAAKTFDKWAKLPEKDYLNNPEDYSWGQQIKNLLRKIGLIGVDPRELATMQPFEKWAEQKFVEGSTRMESIRIDPRFTQGGPNDLLFTSPKEMTYRDLQSLKDTIDQIKMYAKDSASVGRDAKRVALSSYLNEIKDNVSKNFKQKPPEPVSTEDATPMEKAIHFSRWADSSMDSPEPFFNRMDGENVEGPMNRLFQGQVEARVKYRELKTKFADAVAKIADDLPASSKRRMKNRVTDVGLARPVTIREIMSMVENGGNESNYSKMVRGETMRGKDAIFKIDQNSPDAPEKQISDTIQRLAKLLTETEKDSIQKKLDALESFYPEVEKQHIWATGKPPVKIEARQMIEAMGDRRGGYYPEMYDPRYPGGKGELQIAGELGKLLDPSYVKATTSDGYRQSRVEGYAAPIDYNFGRLAGHVDAMAKDIAFRPWLMDANKIVNNPEFQRSMSDYFGSEFKNFANEWVRRTIGADGHPSAKSASVWSQFMGAARHNVTVATLALKPAVFLHHALGFGPAISEVGFGRFFKAYGEFLSHPRDSYRQMISESKEMAHYLETSDANIRQSLDKIAGKTGALADVQRFGMKIIPWGNMLRAIPTYFAAKGKAIAELSAKGKAGAELERLAIQSAEKAVRTTSGSGNPGDVPAIMKSDGMKMLLMFYTPGRVLYSQLKGAGVDVARGDYNKAIMKALWLIPFSAAIHTLASGRRPDEDKDETELGMYAKDALLYPAGALPMGHELAKNALGALSGEGADFSVSVPLFDALEKSFKSVKKGVDWYQDEAEFEDVFREMFKASGYWLGAPTEQVELSGGYMADLMRGNESPNDIFEFAHDILWRKPRSRR